MASPFFSGRIPQELNDRINQHCTETGESKTQVLLNALSKYLDFPIKPPVTTSVSAERFNQLEQRVAELEKKLEITTVISVDNSRIIKDKITGDSNTDLVEESDNNTIEKDEAHDNSASIVEQPDNIDNSINQVVEPTDEDQTQLSISGIEQQSVETNQSNRKPLIIRTNEVPNLPGLESMDKEKVAQQLRNAKFNGKTEVEIGQYLLKYYRKEQGRKGTRKSLLWEVITLDNSDNKPLTSLI